MTDFTFVPKHLATRTHEKMQEVLMDPSAPGPAIYYYMIRGGSEQKNITVLEPGTVGSEYIKTYGHYHIGDLSETYWCLYGEGYVLLQKLDTEDPTVVTEFKVIPMKPQSEVFIPAGYGHLALNTSTTYLTFVDNSPVNFEEKDAASLPGHADYDTVKKMHGFAYYVVEHEGKPALVKNAQYAHILQEDLAGIEKL